MSEAGYIPYCGSPPIPGATTWNLDPILLVALLAGALAYAIGYRRRCGANLEPRACAFCSPLGGQSSRSR